jgi:hypothetical protein
MSEALRETTEQNKETEIRTLMNEYRDEKDRDYQRTIADEKDRL